MALGLRACTIGSLMSVKKMINDQKFTLLWIIIMIQCRAIMSEIAIREQKNRMEWDNYWEYRDKIVLENLITDCSYMANENRFYQPLTVVSDISHSFFVIFKSFQNKTKR